MAQTNFFEPDMELPVYEREERSARRAKVSRRDSVAEWWRDWYNWYYFTTQDEKRQLMDAQAREWGWI